MVTPEVALTPMAVVASAIPNLDAGTVDEDVFEEVDDDVDTVLLLELVDAEVDDDEDEDDVVIELLDCELKLEVVPD